ncbi:MAG: DUF5110 domain-containing protein [Victivallales bacterium]|nr:DUF5110 domain-containing protein [Victivallales bacterium]
MMLKDSAPIGKNTCILKLDNGLLLRVDVLSPKLFRIRYQQSEPWCESAMNRYGILKNDYPETKFASSVDGIIDTGFCRLDFVSDGTFSFSHGTGQGTSVPAIPEVGEGYRISFKLAENERIYGLGDCNRENIMRRGEAYSIWVKNVTGYIPVPMALSSKGWGIMMNTTWRNGVDVGKAQHDLMTFSAPKSNLDFYLFAGDSLVSLLDVYTELTGRPKLLPVWGYALTYVCHEKVTAFDMMNEAMTFRREQIPCDLIGLEPGWMEKNYDASTEKKWHPERFEVPSWAPVSPYTFLSALKRKGFKLSLWLCCDYDLTRYEEELLANKKTTVKAKVAAVDENDDDFEKDQHLNAKKEMAPADGKKEEKVPEPWFEHLKKFVDQGVAAFKLDGAWQVIEHPKRIYANGMDDEQAHNLYPLIYDKQMATGFEEHTKRRAMVYSAGGYAGIQQYVASWAGDTGGGPKPLASMLNLAFSGHSNHSCDMEVMTRQGIHFGFLQTWAQLNNWAYWRQPWYLEDADCDIYRDYAQLRYKLLPYLYSSAWQASQTGLSVMRPMPLVFNDVRWDSVKDEYMLGDALLVTAFANELKLPDGEWLDYWTGQRLTGPAVVSASFPKNRGGCLLLKPGAIIPTWPVRPCVKNGFSEEIGVIANPSATESTFVLYEDEGNTLDYLAGQFCTTTLKCREGYLEIGAAEGTFPLKPAKRTVSLELYLKKCPEKLTIDGQPVNFDWQDGKVTYTFEHATDAPAKVEWR